MGEELPNISPEPLKTTIKRFCVAVVFSIAFAYIESAVVVYLRTIFHPGGFTFPLANFGAGPLWKQLLLTEIGREAATIVLIFTSAWLFGRSSQQRFAYFLIIFAVWDIFYYVWLKVLLDWPASITDWDILFLMPVAWASPVWPPVLVSITMLAVGMIIFYRCSRGRPLKAGFADHLCFIAAALAMVVSFCIGGLHICEADFESYFYRPIFVAGYLLAVGLFVKCLLKS